MKNQNFWKKSIKESAVLNPVDRIAEILFGLIMVLTFTGAISASTDTRGDVRELLWAALGCNIAWGFVDAIMYLMDVALERGHSIKLFRQIQNTNNKNELHKILRNEIQPTLAHLITNEELDTLNLRLKKLPEPSKKILITPSDLVSGLQIFLLVFICTFPVAIPFGFFDDLAVAIRVSNCVALLLLFAGGFILAGYAGFKRGITALLYTLIGVLLVVLTMALGG
jgi:VIT1/CCC1 family predicted Fe2+/Mn2+ transporter